MDHHRSGVFRYAPDGRNGKLGHHRFKLLFPVRYGNGFSAMLRPSIRYEKRAMMCLCVLPPYARTMAMASAKLSTPFMPAAVRAVAEHVLTDASLCKALSQGVKRLPGYCEDHASICFRQTSRLRMDYEN